MSFIIVQYNKSYLKKWLKQKMWQVTSEVSLKYNRKSQDNSRERAEKSR